ncbi:hypothetical protein PY365_08225 [Roseiarcaceae bacterium H3SJ34-1]|uniref:hypothetical protein n=1 Tax=Terripilifer ovatus TaxID=3032367 RepID=UPI003AB96158|nr:hypothetical protein [Roseiarcaceae bacterium H3SJ34-1]
MAIVADDESLRREFEAMAARSGLTIPSDRQQMMFETFLDFRKVLERLHGPRDHTAETAHVFSVDHVTRGTDHE